MPASRVGTSLPGRLFGRWQYIAILGAVFTFGTDYCQPAVSISSCGFEIFMWTLATLAEIQSRNQDETHGNRFAALCGVCNINLIVAITHMTF